MTIAKSFEWNCICQVCRKKVKSSEIKRRWDGFLVCDQDFEIRNALDMPIPPIKEIQQLPFTSPEGTDVFVTVTKDPLADTTGVLPGTFDNSL